MITRYLILYCLFTNFLNLHSQATHLDSVNRIALEFGGTLSWHLGDPNTHFNYSVILPVNIAKLSFISRRHYFAASFGIDIFQNDDNKINNKGDIIKREYYSGSIYYGRLFQHRKSKLYFIPQISLGIRDGYEMICLEKLPYSFEGYAWQEYDYTLSPSIGTGFDLNKLFFGFLTLGIEAQYNHFFQSKIPNGTDLFPEYKINRNVVNVNLKLGFAINWKRKK